MHNHDFPINGCMYVVVLEHANQPVTVSTRFQLQRKHVFLSLNIGFLLDWLKVTSPPRLRLVHLELFFPAEHKMGLFLN